MLRKPPLPHCKEVTIHYDFESFSASSLKTRVPASRACDLVNGGHPVREIIYLDAWTYPDSPGTTFWRSDVKTRRDVPAAEFFKKGMTSGFIPSDDAGKVKSLDSVPYPWLASSRSMAIAYFAIERSPLTRLSNPRYRDAPSIACNMASETEGNVRYQKIVDECFDKFRRPMSISAVIRDGAPFLRDGLLLPMIIVPEIELASDKAIEMLFRFGSKASISRDAAAILKAIGRPVPGR